MPKLVYRNLVRHPVRSILTVLSLMVALFLLCTLRSLVTTLENVADEADSRRLVVQSAVSLYVDLPTSYQAKIEAVPGVELTCKWQWFGGYYQDPRNFFGQFAVDQERLLEIYPELVIAEGSREAFEGNRRGALVGSGLASKFEDFRVGQTIPLVGALFPHPDGPDVPWEFEIEAIYEPSAPNIDSNTFYFHWDYFEKTLEASDQGSPGIGTIFLRTTPEAEPTEVMAAIDGLFENGPQRVQTTPEGVFIAQFASMFGNVPALVSAIGGAVLIAILLACINTMLMAGREQTRDIGIIKALGFRDRTVFGVMICQALVLSILGGGLGILLALASQGPLLAATAAMFPGYRVTPETVRLGAAITLGIGLIAGLLPAWRASRLRVVQALGSND